MTVSALTSALLLLIVSSGCAHRSTGVKPSAADRVAIRLADADRAEVFAIDPRRRTDGANAFGGFEVLGRVAVDDRTRVRRLVEALRNAARDPPEGIAKACMFVPHHGVRFTSATGQTTDVLLCFTCSDAVMTGDRFLISRGVQGPLDDVLRGGGVAVPVVD